MKKISLTHNHKGLDVTRNIISVIIFFVSINFIGCATVFRGYISEVVIKNAPENLKIETIKGADIPVFYATKKVRIKPEYPNSKLIEVIDSSRYVIQLRRNKEYHLVFNDSTSARHYYAYPKLNGWWFVLDIVCGVLPAWVDTYTGNWNYFEPIDFSKIQKNNTSGE